VSLFLVDQKTAGVTLKPYRTVDETKAADVTLNGVKVGADALLGAEGGAVPVIEETTDFATALVCSEAVGADEVRVRHDARIPEDAQAVRRPDRHVPGAAAPDRRHVHQLRAGKIDGVPRGVEDRLVVGCARARSRGVGGEDQDRDACRHVSQEAIQLHGGMGMSEELKVSHTFRRLTMIAQQFGDADHHLARFAALG
jgi:hypothetical protein